MISKADFISQAGAYWDSLSVLEDKCPDFYEYELQFDRLWVDFGHQTLQGLESQQEIPDIHLLVGYP
jgi:hypothetical protein